MAAVIIVFPDYRIAVGSVRVPFLGHAGVLLINNSGVTKYYEYGRYDQAGRGLVRRQIVPNVRIGTDGMPTRETLDEVLSRLSHVSGHGGRVQGVYIQSNNFNAMYAYAEQRRRQNRNRNRRPYAISGLGSGFWGSARGAANIIADSLLSRPAQSLEPENDNCATFAIRVVNQDSESQARAPVLLVRRPINIIEEYRAAGFPIFEYNP